MTVDDLLTYYKCKTAKELSAKLNLSEPLMSVWKNKGIPYLRQRDFQILTKGKLKAEIKPEQLAG